MVKFAHLPSGPHGRLSAAELDTAPSYGLKPGDGRWYGCVSRLDPVVVNDLCDAFCDGTGISTGHFTLHNGPASPEAAMSLFEADSGRAPTFVSRAIRWAVADARLADIDPSYDFDTHATYHGDILSDWKAMTTLMGHPSELIDAEREMTEVELQTANATLRKLTEGLRYMKREEEEGTIAGQLTQPSIYEGLRSAARRREAILATCKGYHTGKSHGDHETFSGAWLRRNWEGRIETMRAEERASQDAHQSMIATREYFEKMARRGRNGSHSSYRTKEPAAGYLSGRDSNILKLGRLFMNAPTSSGPQRLSISVRDY